MNMLAVCSTIICMIHTMQIQPLISVIMPVYNAQDTLSRAADSVLEQTYQNVELILVDDGSTDDSSAIVDAFKAAHPNQIRVLHKKNGGLMRAWRDGLSLSNGEILCFVDSDDWIDEEMLTCMSNHLLRNQDGTFASGQIVCCGCMIEYNNHPPKKEGHGLPEGIYEGEKLDRELKRELLGHENRRITFSRCMKLFSKELFLDNLHFLNPDIRQGEDGNITIPALLDAKRVVVTYDPFYHYAYMENSMVHQYDSHYFDDCLRLLERFRLIQKEKQIISESMIEREFLFLFLQTIKREVRRKDYPHALQKAILEIRRLCTSEHSRELLASYPEKLRDPSYRLAALVCKRPSTARIILVRLIFFIYEYIHGFHYA